MSYIWKKRFKLGAIGASIFFAFGALSALVAYCMFAESAYVPVALIVLGVGTFSAVGVMVFVAAVAGLFDGYINPPISA